MDRKFGFSFMGIPNFDQERRDEMYGMKNEVVEIVNRYNDRCAPFGSKADKVRFIQSSTADKTCNTTLHVRTSSVLPSLCLCTCGKDSIEQDCILQHQEDHNMAARLATTNVQLIERKTNSGSCISKEITTICCHLSAYGCVEVHNNKDVHRYKSHHSPKGVALEALLLCRTTVNFSGLDAASQFSCTMETVHRSGLTLLITSELEYQLFRGRSILSSG
nr:ALA-interacting subunit 3 [Tanacetum cinerariifolium]